MWIDWLDMDGRRCFLAMAEMIAQDNSGMLENQLLPCMCLVDMENNLDQKIQLSKRHAMCLETKVKEPDVKKEEC